ncbi:MAG TPA: histidinol-phosphate transaminase [Candidatus Acidoferrum sp.]|jgi:histidinol-phosphate aminotransferase
MKLNRRSLLSRLATGVAASAMPATLRAHAGGWGSAGHESGKIAESGLLHLDRNENAYGPSAKALREVCESAKRIGRYPEGEELRERVAAHHAETSSALTKISAQEVVEGCGSSDVLRMAAEAFLGPRKGLIQGTPTCEVLSEFAGRMGVRVTRVPLRKDHAHDLNTMLREAQRPKAGGLVYICNPNSPTGTLSPRQDLEGFLGKVPESFHVVMDEAYHHYAGGSGAYESFLDRPSRNPRVIVTRTFSAAYGLAGARVGYGVASADTAEKLLRCRLPFAVNASGTSAALAALGDQEYIARCVKRNFDDRQEFMNQVNARMLRALDSHANFVCLNVMRPAGEILEHYRKNRVAVAPLIPSMPTYLRISLGRPEEMTEFWRVWDLLGSHPMSM